MLYSNLSQSKLISNIDILVRDILFEDININYVSTQLSQLYLPMMQDYDSELEYSPTITAFKKSIEHVMAHQYLKDQRWGFFNTRDFIDFLFLYRDDVLVYDAARYKRDLINSNNLEIDIRKLLTHYSRLLFVRVDLGYLKETMSLVTIDDFHQHIKRLRELISNKKSDLKHLESYAIALEQGYDHGYHCHLLLIYNGADRWKDAYLGQAIGEKWQRITGGLGSYYNCNDPKYKRNYQDRGSLGIGKIHRNNPQEIDNAIRVALYLTQPGKADRFAEKVDQHLKIKRPKMKSFTRGQFNVSWRRGIDRSQPPITK